MPRRQRDRLAVGSGPGPVVRVLLALCGLVMLAAVLPTPLRRLGWAHPARPSEPAGTTLGRAMRIAVPTAAITTSVAGLASIVLVALFPRIIYAGYLGWTDLPAWFAVWVRAPGALFVSTLTLAALAAADWHRTWRTDRQRWTRMCAHRSRARCDRNIGVVAADRACLASARRLVRAPRCESHLVAFTCRGGTGPTRKRPRPESPDSSLGLPLRRNAVPGRRARIDRHEGRSALPLVVGKGQLWR